MTVLDYVVLAVLTIVTVWRIPSALRDRGQRALWATFLYWLIARIVSIPPVAAVVDSLLPYGHLSLLAKHLLGVASSVVALRFVAQISGQDRSRSWRGHRRALLAGGVSLLLAALFLLTPDDIEPSLELLAINEPMSWMTIAYWMVLEGYIGWALATAALLFFRVSRQANGRWLRRASRVIAIGALLDLVYAIVVIAMLLAHLLGVNLAAGALRGPMGALQAVAILMMVAGSAVPALAALTATVRRIRQFRQLLPLWQALTEEFPDIVLHDGLGGWWRWANVRLALYRRVIEIHDGMLSLRKHLPVGTRAAAEEWVARSDLVGAEAEAAVEACCLSLALLVRKNGEASADDAQAEPPRRGEGELDAEVRWLLMVNTAFNTQLAVDFGGAARKARQRSRPDPFSSSQTF